jgi:hypothetical protein
LPDVAERSALAREVATAHRKGGNLAQAKRFLSMSASLDPKQDVQAELAAVDAELKRIEENERRMPRIHANLDQQEKVRPRI